MQAGGEPWGQSHSQRQTFAIHVWKIAPRNMKDKNVNRRSHKFSQPKGFFWRNASRMFCLKNYLHFRSLLFSQTD
jgi:hypothetical protein